MHTPEGLGCIYIKQDTSTHGITNIYQLMCDRAWANQLNYSSMASLYLYWDLLDCIVGLNLMIKMFLLVIHPGITSW